MNPALLILLLLTPFAAMADPLKSPPLDAGFAISLSVAAVKPQPGIGVYDIDLFDSERATIDALHAAGAYVICYFSAGSRENWRPDATGFPEIVLGSNYEGWPG